MEFTHEMGRQFGLMQLAVRRGINERLVDDRGEGVISMAIAVLIIAAIGGVLWVFFNTAAGEIGQRVVDDVNDISGPAATP